MIDYEGQAIDKGFEIVIGVDEAGRGPLAGPVVAAAVALRKRSFIQKISDSKKITAKQRLLAFEEIQANAYVGVGIMSETVIDECNILQATFLAMTNAVKGLIEQLPETKNLSDKIYLLIDGDQFKTTLPYSFATIVKGDSLVQSIACASIIAKVTRDRILDMYDQIFPEYGFRKHKGYPTLAHKKAIREFGPSLIQRKTFSY